MKKLLLGLGMACIGSLGVQANQMAYGYCSDPIGAIGTPDPDPLTTAVAIGLNSTTTTQMAGSKATGVQLVLGENLKNYDVTIYLTHALDEKPFLTAKGTASDKWSVINFDESYELDGTPIYFGYTVHSQEANQFPICIDASGMSANPLGGYYMIRDDIDGVDPIDDIFSIPIERWATTGMQYGNICCRLMLEGDNLPTDHASITDLYAPKYVKANETFYVQMGISNRASNDINTIELNYKLGKDATKPLEIKLDEPLNPGETTTVSVPLMYTETKKGLTIMLSISKVNGNENQYTAGFMASTWCIDGLFDNTMVVESNTGIECDTAPLGIVAFEKMKEAYPDKFIGINIHNFGDDPMLCSPYKKWNTWSGINSAPMCTINRDRTYVSIAPTFESILKDVYPLITGGSPYSLELSTTINEENPGVAQAEVYVTSCIDNTDVDYRIEFVLTQDEVGPYDQLNNFAVADPDVPTLDGWTGKGEKVSTLFNDVALDIFNWNSAAPMLPENLTAGSYYPYSQNLTLISCTNLDGASLDNVNVTALLVDKESMEILNAIRVKLGEKSAGFDAARAGIEPTFEPLTGVNAYGIEGGVAVKGDFGQATVYTLDGAVAGILSAEGTLATDPGLYIVKATGNGKAATFKVLAR